MRGLVNRRENPWPSLCERCGTSLPGFNGYARFAERPMAPRPLRLNEFLSSSNLPSALNLPWAHSTAASNLMDIIADGKIVATPCNVFRGEKLCYFFIGR